MTYVLRRKSYPPLNLLLYISGCSAAGSALDWGSRGRKFKSCHSDFKKQRNSNEFRCFFTLLNLVGFSRVKYFKLPKESSHLFYRLSSTFNKNFQTLCTEGMLKVSLVVWMSCISGPMETQSSPGILLWKIPHSSPA